MIVAGVLAFVVTMVLFGLSLAMVAGSSDRQAAAFLDAHGTRPRDAIGVPRGSVDRPPVR